MASRSTVQSKWEMSRRSINIGKILDVRELLTGGLLLVRWRLRAPALEIGLDDFFRERRGGGAAVAAVLDNDGDGDLGIVRRRVRDEPGVVADEIGQFFALHRRAFHLG